MSPTVRHRRLTADFQMVQTLASNSGGALAIERVAGDPPEKYVVLYRCKGIERLDGTHPIYRELHRVQIDLSASYPAQKPAAAMLTPLFHPHVFANNVICLGAKWSVAEYLDSLVLRIGSIIQYDPQYFDFNSPANSTAAMWAKQNMSLFPVGRCTFKAPKQEAGTISWTNIK